MPTPNKTMLDQLASMMKSSGRKKPEIIQATTIRDPLGFSIERRRAIGRNFDPTPERSIYQRGLESIQNRGIMKAQNELDDLESDKELLQSQWDDAVNEAKDAMAEDWRIGLDDNDFSEIDPDYLEVETPSTDLTDYWPDYGYMSPREFGQRSERLDEDISHWEDIVGYRESPAYRMALQRQSPRYRNYRRAMMLQADNVRRGRLNAKIMYLARMGYSLPEIRAILNGTMPTPAVGGR